MSCLQGMVNPEDELNIFTSFYCNDKDRYLGKSMCNSLLYAAHEELVKNFYGKLYKVWIYGKFQYWKFGFSRESLLALSRMVQITPGITAIVLKSVYLSGK